MKDIISSNFDNPY